jgi:Replication protein
LRHQHKEAPKASGVGQPEAALRTTILGASLGNTGKRSSIEHPCGLQRHPENLNWTTPKEETGEVTPYTVAPNRKSEAIATVYKTAQQIRGERWALKSVVNELLPNSSTAKCSRLRRKDSSIEIMISKEHGKAFYSGLQHCGSIWNCPNCAAKISERRREELKQAITVAESFGWRPMLLTLTFPHGMGDDVGEITDKMIKAWDKCGGTRAARLVKQAIGLEGTIRAMEPTYGENGFHPHLHIILFVSSNMSTQSVQAGYAPLWQQACVKVGLPMPSDARGCRVDDNSKAAEYVSKWGLESELVKGHTKRAKKGMTPWDMLRAYLYDDDKHAGDLFKVYAAAFKGRRQLVWSKGLKKKLLIVDLSDEELAAREDSPSTPLSKITVPQWRAIYKAKMESAVLDVAENNPDAIPALLESFSPNEETLKGGGPACGEVSFYDDEVTATRWPLWFARVGTTPKCALVGSAYPKFNKN